MPIKSEILREKLDLFFTNRHKQIDLFTRLITSPGLESSLLTVRGLGGIGKTMLLGAFKRICEEIKAPAATVDVGVQRSAEEVLRSMRDQLVQSEGKLSADCFDYAVDRYLNIDKKLRKLESIPIRALDLISKAAVLAPEGSSLTGTERLDIEQGDYGLVINRIYQQLDKSDADYFVNPVDPLTRELLADINKYAQSKHICVMFDRFEVVPVLVDRWIRKDFFANLAELVLVVISGRPELPPEWGEWRPLIKNIELSPFPKTEIQELLQLFGITSSYLIDQIAQLSGGVPLAVSLAAQLVKERGTEDFSIDSEKYNVIEQLVEVLVRDASPELERTLEVCAILRWFNDEAISALLPEDKFSFEMFKQVRGYDFVRQGRYALEIHDRVREFINQDLFHRAPSKYKSLNHLASEYYAKLIAQNVIRDQKLLILEKLYHKLRADEKEGMVEMRQVFNDAALLIQPAFSQDLIEVAESAGLQDDVNKLWVEYFKGSLARQNSDFEKAEGIFRQLAQNPMVEIDREIKAELIYYWGVSLWYVCKFRESQEISEQAVQLNKDLNKVRFENRAMGVIGLAQDRMGEFKHALSTVSEMVSQARKTDDRNSEAYGLNSIGYFSWHIGQWDKAEEALMQAHKIWISLGSKFGECYSYGHLGRIYADIIDFGRAKEFLDKGLSLASETNNKEMQAVILINKSAYEYYRANYDGAMQNAANAVTLTKGMKHAYFKAEALNLCGDILVKIGQSNKGIEKYEASLDICNQILVPWVAGKNKVSLFERSLTKAEDEAGYFVLAESLAKSGYNDLLSKLQMIYADWLFQKSQIKSTTYYQQACLTSAKYNWHYLDRAIRVILTKKDNVKSRQDVTLYKEVLSCIIENWGEEDIAGISLMLLESKAPRILKGGDTIKTSLRNRLLETLQQLT